MNIFNMSNIINGSIEIVNVFGGMFELIFEFLKISFSATMFFLAPIIALSCASYVLYRILTKKF